MSNQEKKKSGKIITIFCAFAVLIIAAVIAVAIGSDNFTKNFKAWFNYWGKGQQQSVTVIPGLTGSAYDGKGKKLNYSSTYELPENLIFAGIPNEGSNIYEVTFSVTSLTAGAQQAWQLTDAEGNPTDKVILETSPDNTAAIIVKCKEPFENQLILKVYETDNKKNFVTCNIDFLKNTTGFEFFEMYGTDFDDNIGCGYRLGYGVGTLEGKSRISRLRYFIDFDFQKKVQSMLTFPISFTAYSFASDDLTETAYDNAIAADGTAVYEYSMFINSFDDYDQEHKDAIYYAWNQAYMSL